MANLNVSWHLSALVFECICERTAKFHEKILFGSGVINLEILTTKYLGCRYSDLSGDCFTFQQDNAPAHRVSETVQLLTCETPDFIPPALWPTNSPDLNPVDYQIGRSCRSVCSQIHDVDQLKSRLIKECEHFDQVFIDEVIRQCLQGCIWAHGGHFEHIL